MATGGQANEATPYVELDRDAWAELGSHTDQPLSELEVERVRGLGDQLDVDEVQQIYLPLSRLLSLYVESSGALHRAQEAFLDRPQPPRTPFVIGLAGWWRSASRRPPVCCRRSWRAGTIIPGWTW
jgi:type I pantothenate kinase